MSTYSMLVERPSIAWWSVVFLAAVAGSQHRTPAPAFVVPPAGIAPAEAFSELDSVEAFQGPQSTMNEMNSVGALDGTVIERHRGDGTFDEIRIVDDGKRHRLVVQIDGSSWWTWFPEGVVSTSAPTFRRLLAGRMVAVTSTSVATYAGTTVHATDVLVCAVGESRVPACYCLNRSKSSHVGKMDRRIEISVDGLITQDTWSSWADGIRVERDQWEIRLP